MIASHPFTGCELWSSVFPHKENKKMKKALLIPALLLFAAPASPQTTVASAGYITGTVRFDGTAPHQRLIDISNKSECAAIRGDQLATTESVVVGAAGELANVVVYISRGLQ
jgi:hypothetical protein